ncbi:hypothetical protein NMY22_g6598 [Coprinellus aureogranulatus]|nr:hypothetical protein NMY22_g6598 [Coprinellus aureogranulatus]
MLSKLWVKLSLVLGRIKSLRRQRGQAIACPSYSTASIVLVMKKGFLGFIWDQLTPVPPLATSDLAGQTVVVTGANTGLGFEAAKHFARMNPGRSFTQNTGIKEAIGFDRVELWLLDLAKFSSVVEFANKFQNGGGRLDILVANAAIMPNKYKLTSDGWEESLQVNNLSTFLLCLLLAPLAIETAKKYGSRPRISIVSSETHYWAPAIPEKAWEATSTLQYLNSPEYCTPEHCIDTRYMETKLLSVFFTRALADLLKNTPVIVDTVTPARTTEQGARQLVYAALGSSDNPGALHGQFLNLHKVEEPSNYVLGEAGKARQDKLWNDLIRELSKVDARVGEIVRQYQQH